MEWCGGDESPVFVAHARDVRNDNGKRLPPFTTNRELAFTNTFFSTRNGGISHTHNGTSPNDRSGSTTS